MISLRHRRCSVVVPVVVAACFLGAAVGCSKKDEATPVPHDARTLIPVDTTDSTIAIGDTAAAAAIASAPEASGGAELPVEKLKPLPAATDETRTETRSLERPAASASRGPYSLQLGSFRSEANADQQAARLRELGYDPQIEVAVLGGQTYHRVSLLGLASKDEARRLGEKIRADLGIAYLIRRTD